VTEVAKVVFVAWMLLCSAGLIPAEKLPPPTTVWRTAVSLVTTDSPAYGTLQNAMLVSLERMAVGFAVGASVAVLLALVAGLSRPSANAGLGFIISQATPFLRNDVILVALAVYAILGLITDAAGHGR
jgi:ABC-type nitrate/sulfonate/bicarbonate transport system permease component